MAVIAVPTIRTVVSGDGLSALDTSETFTLAEKIENTFSVISTGNAVSLDLTLVNNIETIMFNSSGSYIVTIATDTNTLAFEVSGVFKFNPSSTFMATLDSITISTASTTAVTVDARIYGVVTA